MSVRSSSPMPLVSTGSYIAISGGPPSGSVGRGRQHRFDDLGIGEATRRRDGHHAFLAEALGRQTSLLVADAARVVRLRHADGSGALAHGARPRRSAHLTRRMLRLDERRDVERPGAHRRDHLVDAVRRQVIHVTQIDLHARRAMALPKALYLLIGKEAVVGGFQLADSQALAEALHDLLGAPQHARKVPADLKIVLADRTPIEQGVERDDALALSLRHAADVGDVVDNFARNIPDVVLKQVDQRQKGTAALRILRDDPVDLRLQLRPQLREVYSAHSAALRLFACHRSTSPKTGSSDPIITTTSAIRFPAAIFFSACRL